MGLGIPIYALVREWKSFHECNDGVTMEWEWDSELTLKDTHFWRGLTLAGVCILSIGIVAVIALEACMPRYRGDLTTAQFAQNYNRLASYFDYDSDFYLDENDIWVEYTSNVYSQGVTFYTWGSSPSPDVLDFDIVEEDGIQAIGPRHHSGNLFIFKCQYISVNQLHHTGNAKSESLYKRISEKSTFKSPS